MTLRMEDWDELSDFGRLVPLVQYGHAGDDLYLRLGELRGLSLGHGTIVFRYHNNVRLNTYHSGLYLRGDWGMIGAEGLVDDILDPSLAVTRIFSRPMADLHALPDVLRKFRVGITAGADIRSPIDVQVAQMAEPEGGHYVVRARSQDATALLGLDIEAPVWESESVQFVPYLDANTVDLRGMGVHAGLRTEVNFSPLTRLTTRLEYRYAGPGYESNYVSPFYEVERWSYRGGAPKLSWLREASDSLLSSGRHGISFEGDFTLSGVVNFMVTYTDEEGVGNSDFMLRMALPDIQGFRCALTYANLGFEEAADLLEPADTVFALSARYQIGDYFYLKAQAVNEWWLNQEPNQKKEFETTLNFDVGVGAVFTL
jgi:hypothetical protein